MRRLVLLALVPTLTLTLTGCGGQPTPAAAPSPRSPEPAAPPQPTPSTETPAPLGQTKTVGSATVVGTATVHAVKTLNSAFPPERKGYKFTGVNVQVCLTKPGNEPYVTVSWRPWSLQMADDSVTEAANSWSEDHFSVPLIPPTGRNLYPGKCIRGWVLFETPKDAKIRTVRYSAVDESGNPIREVEWAAG